ncbi:MAG: hypothetical protein EBY22_00010 [Gammaproteobacteria bacterium]|nr:hypothetical protein [Gammaproteobacteria bacterium]
MLLQQAGTSMNASNAARPTSHHVPKYQEFMNMVYVLRRLQLKDALDLSYTESDDGKTENLVFHLNKNGHLTAKETLLLKKAGVEVYHNDIVFSNHAGPHKTLVVTRSVLGVLNYLSKGVAIPPEDVKNNMLTMTVYRNGQMFDWQRVLEGIMKIEYSSTKPKNASVEIYYLNGWYYISNTDNNSKKSFMLLTNLLGLIALTPQPSPETIVRLRGLAPAIIKPIIIAIQHTAELMIFLIKIHRVGSSLDCSIINLPIERPSNIIKQNTMNA